VGGERLLILGSEKEGAAWGGDVLGVLKKKKKDRIKGIGKTFDLWGPRRNCLRQHLIGPGKGRIGRG